MFANLIQLLTRSEAPPRDYDVAFVKGVDVKSREPRSRLVEKRLVWGWIAILVKCIIVDWAMRHYNVPINPGWVIYPTLAMGAVCTLLYCWRRG